MRLRRDHQAGYNRHQVGYMRLCSDHQVNHRLIRITDTGWPKCTDCTDFYFVTLKLYGMYGLYGFLSWKYTGF